MYLKSWSVLLINTLLRVLFRVNSYSGAFLYYAIFWEFLGILGEKSRILDFLGRILELFWRSSGKNFRPFFRNNVLKPTFEFCTLLTMLFDLLCVGVFIIEEFHTLLNQELVGAVIDLLWSERNRFLWKVLRLFYNLGVEMVLGQRR